MILSEIIQAHPWRWIIPICGTMLQAVASDLQGYISARSEDPAVKFDWPLFAVRALYGAVTGALISLGLSVAPQ